MKLPLIASNLLLIAALGAAAAGAQSRSQLRFCIASDPKTFNPLLVDDDPGETIRYLTGGVLVRLNRASQQLEPGLASTWRVSKGGNSIEFTLRPNLRFSDGTPFSVDDVAYTMRQLMDPALHSPSGDAFRAGNGQVISRVIGKDRISLTFSVPIVGLDKLFDQVAIMSAKSPAKEMAVLGSYYVAEDKAGSYLVLKRNPNYWKHDAHGQPLPYIDSIRVDIQQNRDIEMLRFSRGEIDFINSLNAEYYDKLVAQSPRTAIDAGVGLDAEQLWFNQVPNSPMPAYKKAWFTSAAFRKAISASINREDLARLAFRGHARPAVSWISPANKFWFNAKLTAHPFNQKAALESLAQEGFKMRNGTLYDREGHTVEFSVITNAGNKYRERMATLIQQDLAGIGVRLNVVTLDFPSLIERITRTFNYESCLLGLINNDLDPDTQMSAWLSSGANHAWNPMQKTAATAWEAEIDRLMHLQASTIDEKKRKQAVDRVQEIAWQQEPLIFLVNKNALSAISPNLRNVLPVVLRPQVYWNIDQLALDTKGVYNR